MFQRIYCKSAGKRKSNIIESSALWGKTPIIFSKTLIVLATLLHQSNIRGSVGQPNTVSPGFERHNFFCFVLFLCTLNTPLPHAPLHFPHLLHPLAAKYKLRLKEILLANAMLREIVFFTESLYAEGACGLGAVESKTRKAS